MAKKKKTVVKSRKKVAKRIRITRKAIAVNKFTSSSYVSFSKSGYVSAEARKQHLEVIVAEFVAQNPRSLPSRTTVYELMQWSKQQAEAPTGEA